MHAVPVNIRLNVVVIILSCLFLFFLSFCLFDMFCFFLF